MGSHHVGGSNPLTGNGAVVVMEYLQHRFSECVLIGIVVMFLVTLLIVALESDEDSSGPSQGE